MVLEPFKSSRPKTKWLLLLSLLFLILTLQANIAWLNPRPGFEPRTKLFQQIPLLWQYNLDSDVEFFAAQTFPASFKDEDIRISRPTYPFFVRIFRGIVEIFTPLSIPYSTAVGYVMFKFLVYLLYCYLFLKLLMRWVDEHTALLALILSLFHSFAITFIGTYHTTELQFITPVIVMTLFLSLSKHYTSWKNVLYSFIVGVLMLAKPNYAIYLAILLFGLYKKKSEVAALSFVTQWIPLALWLLFLKLYGLPYSNNEAEHYGQGVWLYQDFILREPFEMLKTVGISWLNFLTLFWKFYGIWLLFGLAGFIHLFQRKKHEHEYKRGFWIFILLLFFAIWVQAFAAQRYADYMVADMGFVIFGLAAYFIFTFLPTSLKRKPRLVIVPIGIFWLTFNVLSMLHLPWIHPYNHRGYSKEEITEVTTYFTEHPNDQITFLPKFTTERVYNPLNLNEEALYMANAIVTHDLSDAFYDTSDGCPVYRIQSPHTMIQGDLILDHPEDIEAVYFALTEEEWYPIPVENHLVLDYTMHQTGPHTTVIDPSTFLTWGGWGGYSYLTVIDEPRAVSDTMEERGFPYDFVLYENGIPLPYPHQSNTRVLIEFGQGQYSLRDDGVLIFSTSDNSDPHTNGRTYTASYTGYSTFIEPFESKEYFLKFCSKNPDDSFEASIHLRTLVQYNKAIYYKMIELSESLPQITLTSSENE